MVRSASSVVDMGRGATSGHALRTWPAENSTRCPPFAGTRSASGINAELVFVTEAWLSDWGGASLFTVNPALWREVDCVHKAAAPLTVVSAPVPAPVASAANTRSRMARFSPAKLGCAEGRGIRILGGAVAPVDGVLLIPSNHSILGMFPSPVPYNGRRSLPGRRPSAAAMPGRCGFCFAAKTRRPLCQRHLR
jgi:hypothetical protein